MDSFDMIDAHLGQQQQQQQQQLDKQSRPPGSGWQRRRSMFWPFSEQFLSPGPPATKEKLQSPSMRSSPLSSRLSSPQLILPQLFSPVPLASGAPSSQTPRSTPKGSKGDDDADESMSWVHFGPLEAAAEDDESNLGLPICDQLRAASQSSSAAHQREASIELFEIFEMVSGDTPRGERESRALAHLDGPEQLPEEALVIMDEILSTERAYGTQLEMLEGHFLRPLLKLGSRMTLNPRYRTSDVTPEQVASVTGNIESIKQLNKDLLVAMRGALLEKGPENVIALCRVFLDRTEQLDRFTAYEKNYIGKVRKSLLALAGLQDFHKLLESKRSYGQGGNSLDFNALLKVPIERIAAYVDLFTKLKKNFDTWSADSLAADSIRKLVGSVVERLVLVLRTFNAGAQSSSQWSRGTIPLFAVERRSNKLFGKFFKGTELTLEIDIETKSLTVSGKEQQVLAGQAILGVERESDQECIIKWADKHGLAASAQFRFSIPSERNRFVTAYKIHLAAMPRPGMH
jgi:hypothetical protein